MATMKRIFLMVLMFSMFAGAVSFTFSQDQPAKVEDKKLDGESTDESLKDKQPTAEELAYRSDTVTILKLIGNIRDFKSNYQDTEVQKKARERKLKEALARINASYKGKRLTLQRAELDDVIANDNIEHFPFLGKKEDWEVPGKYTATYYIPLPKKVEDSTLHRGGIAIGQRKNKDDGTTAYEEFRQGLPSGQLDFESFQYLIVKIVKTYPNENSVINLRKGSVAPLTGKIHGVYYNDIGDELTIWID
ncbi:MAG TPA: hypothetical protein P5522_10145 [Spirochaetia bacterium]|nr:hypothetical protein [Spirochaetota bacterium]HRV29133.1 hypothetical protein [Spirochaetia bacterium]